MKLYIKACNYYLIIELLNYIYKEYNYFFFFYLNNKYLYITNFYNNQKCL